MMLLLHPPTAAKPSDLSTITPNPNTTMPPKGTLHASLPGTGPTGPDGTPIVAPRRFKSAFIMFSSVRHKEIKKELAEEGIAKKVRVSCVRACSPVFHESSRRRVPLVLQFCLFDTVVLFAVLRRAIAHHAAEQSRAS